MCPHVSAITCKMDGNRYTRYETGLQTLKAQLRRIVYPLGGDVDIRTERQIYIFTLETVNTLPSSFYYPLGGYRDPFLKRAPSGRVRADVIREN